MKLNRVKLKADYALKIARYLANVLYYIMFKAISAAAEVTKSDMYPYRKDNK